MLGALTNASARKLRLFACACFRQSWKWWHHAVEVAERFADGQATDAELTAAREEAIDQVNANPSWDWHAFGQMAGLTTTGLNPRRVASYICAQIAVARGSEKPSWW